MQWKRKLSGVLAGAMLLGLLPTTALAWDAPGNQWEAASESVAARFFVGSDTHIGRNNDASKKLTNALDAFYKVDPDADGVLLVGDVTNNGADSEYDTLMGVVNASEFGEAGKVELSMGNHEFNNASNAVDRFETKTEQDSSEVIYYNNEGGTVTASASAGDGLVATVIRLSANNYGGDYTDNYDMVKTALETSTSKNVNAPIIVMGHHGIANTAYVTNEWKGNYGEGTEEDMVALFKQYSQVIHISGHSHATLEDARSIYQDDGYTAIQDGTIGAYFENESGKVDPDDGDSATRPADSEIASQALRIDVLEDGTVKIYRMNLTTGEYMYEDEPWTFKVNGEEELPYTANRTSGQPTFAEGASVSQGEVDGKTIHVQFPAAEPASGANNDMVHEYQITLTPKNGGDAVTKSIFSDYYMAEENQKDTWDVTITGLKADTEYDVSVKAVTSFDVASEAITGTVKTEAPTYPPQPILDVDFSNGNQGVDAQGHTMAVYGEPTFQEDADLGRTVATFDGENDGLRYTMTDEDYDRMGQNFTVELYYKPNDTANNNPMGNTQTSGFCFEQKSGTNTVEFWTHIGGSYKKPAVQVVTNQWNHLVATYDGENVKLYLNGELQDTVAATGAMSEPPHYLFLGGDTKSDGSLEYEANCSIALARVYEGTMTADDVKAAYQTATQPDSDVTIPDADILDVDFSDGKENDESGNNLTATKRGNGTITYIEDEDLNKTVANFDGSSAYSYPMSGQYDKLQNGLSFEVTFKYNSLPGSGEYDLLSNQQNGGFGLGTDGGRYKFFCHVDGGYKTPSTPADAAGDWHHAVGVWDGETVKLYIDGTLESTVTATGDLGLAQSGANEVFIGGDSDSNNGLQFSSNARIANARIYSTPLTADQVAALADQELPEQPTDPEEPENPESLTPDMLNVDFTDGTAQDKSETQNTWDRAGSPVIEEDTEMGKNVGVFNGSYDAYLYPFDDTKYRKMSDGVTIESIFKYDEIPSGESDMFSNQQGGGIGLGLEGGRLQFFCNINKSGGDNGYVQPNAEIEAGQWYHAVGVFDGSTVKLYLNGVLVDSKPAGGTTIHWPGGEAKNFVIGGDSSSSGGAESFAKGRVSLARLYSDSMTDDQVKALYESLDPVMIEVEGTTGSIALNERCTVAAGGASNGAAVTVTVTAPDGETVSLQDNQFTPDQEGDYTFTYTVEDSSAKRIFVRAAVDMANLPVNLGLVAAEQVASGNLFNVSIHMNRDSGLTVGNTSFTLTYNPDLVSYVGQENAKSGLTVEDDGNGNLKVTYTGNVATDAFNNYSTTRLVRLTFESVEADSDQNAEFSFADVNIDASTNKKNAEGATVKLVGQGNLDLNGDGVIGAGDVALAETTDQAKTIAQAAAIYPYKHAVVITMDGGGICFKPNEMYYASNGSTTLTDDPDILAKRTNEYAMELFNEYCATSYSAQSETPTISAQNYTSIIHGKAYATAQKEYQITNNEAGAYYYPDFGKEVAVYPSIFEALGQSFPNRGNAAFAEWTPIVNGIIEPDAPVYLHGSTKNTGDMQDVADYIKSENYKNTAMIYMQSDYMDAVGHSNGYYTDKYYTELERYDDYFKAIMDALEETGTKDETLVLFTADHGGTAGGSHGGTTNQEYDVQIALGGQTIDSGATLSGGTNHDIPQLVLAALRGDALPHMDGSADLFEAASLTQEELVEKDRAVETLTSTSGTNVNAVEFTLSDRQDGYTVNTLDLVLNLNGQEITSVDTEGTVVRQDVQDGALYLTIVYDGAAPDTLARVNLSGSADGVKVTEYMLGTDQGKEIYGDLVNTAGTLEVTPEPVQQATVTVKNGEETVATAEVTIGEDYTLPAAPTRPGYVFQGWMSSADNQRYQAGASVTIDGDTSFTAQWEPVSRPDPDPTPNPDPDPEDPTGPSAGDAQGWQEIADELADAANGETVTVDMNGATEIPQEALEAMAGKDVALVVELEDNVQWTIRGEDLAQADAIEDLDLGVTLDTHGIPSQVVDTVAGDGTVVQFTLAHEGAFGFPMTLTVPLGRDNAGAWANLYHYNEDAAAMDLEASVRIAADGTAIFPLTHASQYAVVIDESDHSQGSGEQHPFTDVSADAWYAQAVQYVYENGLMDGIENNQFAPEHTTTRAQLVTILYRLEGQPAVTGESGFTDVEAGTWYTDAVAWAAANGIVNGVSDTRFAPGDEITRQQMAAILYRYAEAKGYDVTASADLSGYSDAETIQEYAQIPMAWACAQGLLQGFEDDTLRPAGNATRAQIATILMRFCQTVAQ